MNAGQDSFVEIARYYDRIMSYVNYGRWFAVASTIAESLTKGFVHLDAACGTGTLLRKFQQAGWNSVGIDLSAAMLRAGRAASREDAPPAAAADLRALPFRGSIDYVTCLFDSINFLLEIEDVRKAFGEISTALTPSGLLYFDVVTERMVTQHFEGQEWTEYDGGLTTTWRSRYNRKTRIADTDVHVGNGDGGMFRERIYAQDEIEDALQAAGLVVLGAFDAHTWKAPGRKTVRIDFVAAKTDSRELRKQFKTTSANVRYKLV